MTQAVLGVAAQNPFAVTGLRLEISLEHPHQRWSHPARKQASATLLAQLPGQDKSVVLARARGFLPNRSTELLYRSILLHRSTEQFYRVLPNRPGEPS